MNIIRFSKKCMTDQSAAWRSVKLVSREFYGKFYWYLKPNQVLKHHLSTGGVLLLEPKHSFTECFYPGVDQYEPDIREALPCFLKPGDVFVDCGANIGYFSIIAGHIIGETGKVVAIEANPTTYKLLERNLEENNFGISIHCALNTCAGDVELFMPIAGGDVFSSLKKGGYVKGSVRSFKVKAKTLDDVIQEEQLNKVDVVKIDIEGAELDVLNSAPYILSTLRPIVITEYGTNTWTKFDATPEKLKELVQKYSYQIKLFDVQSKKLMPISEEVWLSHYKNLFLVPTEKIDKLG